MSLREEIEFRPMELDDLPGVLVIERASFPTPWSEEVFHKDLTENANSQYIVGILDGRVAAYGGIWLLSEVGHITTIAVEGELRRNGLGDETLRVIINIGLKAGIKKFTLEVRASNEEAIRLYEKHGFKPIGIRKNYYKEINEDALVMWTGNPPFEG